MSKRDDKAYVVTGSEDGIIGVANSARKAAAMALAYVTQDRCCEWTLAMQEEMQAEIRRTSHTSRTTASIQGLADCTGSVRAEVDAFSVNYTMGRDF